MQAKIKIEKTVNIRYLHVNAGVRYFEDGEVNGTQDSPRGDLIPCVIDGRWKPIIDIDSGVITNWKFGKEAKVHYKVCDDGEYKLIDEEGNVVFDDERYVPDCLAIQEKGFGDYIIMIINADGSILDWEFDIEDFFID